MTGIPIETLRVWERRYGFPKPGRVAGSNRRNYRVAEIERLRWVARAIARGYRAGDVVPRRIDEIEALLGPEDSPAELAVASGGLATIDELVRALASDEVTRFETELRRLAAALGPKRFVTDLAHPLAVRVGESWEAGQLEVRQEHFASEALITQLRQSLAAFQDVDGAPTVVLTTLTGEAHSLGLAMVALYLAVSGARPRMLGAGTPPDQIVAAARALDANVVGLTVTPVSATPTLAAELRALAHGLPRRTRLWVGGSAEASRLGSPPRATIVRNWLDLDAAVEAARA